MKKYIVIGLVMLVSILACAKNSTKVTEVEAETSATPEEENLPHDYPAILIPPDAVCTHGATGMMKAEENPEGNAWFRTDVSIEEIVAFFEGIEGWTVEGKEKLTSEYGEGLQIVIKDTTESSTLEARVELTTFSDEEGNLFTEIHVAYRGHGVLKLDIDGQ